MSLILLITGCLWILVPLLFLVKYLPYLRSTVLTYGKLNGITKEPTSTLGGILWRCTVPKSWFAHFYLFGVLFSVYCWIELTMATSFKGKYLGPLLLGLRYWNSSQGSQAVHWSVCLFGLFLFSIHLTRRLYESWFVERPSPMARMNISHYLFGLGFYACMVFGTWLEGVSALSLWEELDPALKYFSYQDLPVVSTTIGTTLFFYAMKHQYQCHSILASLRSNNKDSDNSTRYRIPYGDWFEFLVAPHYTCDVLVYLSLCIIYQGRSLILLSGLVLSFANLSITASETKSWYIATFPNYPKHRWIMVPGLF